MRLEGNYPYLATQKFSSNVVEKCLKLAGEENRARIVRELMSSSRLAQLLQDPYANYVMQSALSVSKVRLQGPPLLMWNSLCHSGSSLKKFPFCKAGCVVELSWWLSQGALHAALVEAIRPHLPALRSSPYGKRILSRTNLKK